MIPESLIRSNPSWKVVYFSLLFAFLINLIPKGGAFPFPDFLAIVIVFWSAYMPARFSLLNGWLLGIVMDIHTGALLGEHALIYSFLSYAGMLISRRISWTSMSAQFLQLLPLFLSAFIMHSLVRYAANDGTAPWWFIFKSPLEAISSVFISFAILKVLNRRTGPSIQTRSSKKGLKI